MNNEQRLEVNIAAAGLLGHHELDSIDNDVFWLEESGAEGLAYNEDESLELRQFFDIFTNAQDLLDVVKVLGTKYKVHVYYDNGWDVHLTRDAYIGVSGTYEEAVAAAVLSYEDIL